MTAWLDTFLYEGCSAWVLGLRRPFLRFGESWTHLRIGESWTHLRIGESWTRGRVVAGLLLSLLSGAMFPGVHADPLRGQPLALEGGDLGELKTDLRDSNKYVRRDAVNRLAKRSEPEAWALLLEALGDKAGEVADSAAFFLAHLPQDARCKAIRKDLFGKEGLGAREVQVRRYAAELTGRLDGPVDFSALGKALRDKDGAVRRLSAFSVERLAQRSVIPDTERSSLSKALVILFERDKDPLVRARALAARVALGQENLAKLLQKAAGDKLPAVRAAACVLIAGQTVPNFLDSGYGKKGASNGRAGNSPLGSGEMESMGAGVRISVLSKLASDSAVAVRVAAASGLGDMIRKTDELKLQKGALEVLAERLELEPSTSLSWHLLDLLRGLSGRMSGRDPRPWKAWVGGLGPDWKPYQEPRDAERKAAADDRSASLVGLPIRSDSVAFLIDFSGSIWRERSEGNTIKAVLDEKLREALEGLPEDTRFLLVPFTNEPHPWQEELVLASERNVQKALRWFEKARFQGTGNAWDAMLLAQDVEGVDTLILLSDGAPSGGVRYRLELIGELFFERNLGRQMTLDCILVDAPKKLQRYWGRLSRATGGRVLAISL